MRSATYLPILKGKQGEFTALRELEPTEAMSPLIEIPKVPWDFDADAPECSVEEHVARFSKAIGRARPSCANLLFDAGLLEDEGPNACSGALRQILENLSSSGRPAIPVTGLERPSKYQQTIRAAHQRDGAGCCIRLEREDLFDPVALKTELAEVLKATAVPPEESDLVVDFKTISEDSEAADLALMRAILPELPLLHSWRSFWLAGTAFPEFLTNVPTNSTRYLRRVEWTIWSTLLTSLSSTRVPRFSDYGIAHPANLDFNPRKMRPSVNLRYTVEDHWFVLKARSARDFGNDQFKSLCAKLVETSEFYGADFSWGDAFIWSRAKLGGTPGNASTWRKVGNSHHFQVALAQIDKVKTLL